MVWRHAGAMTQFFVVKTWPSVIGFAVLLTAIALLATGLSINANYDPAILEIVYPKAMMATFTICMPLAFFAGLLLRRSALLTDRLTKLLQRDRLTDVATRDYFFSALAAAPDSYGVSLMVDIDHFKSVNDTHGHFAGDDVIATVAGLLKDNIRPADIVCRFGGEEFVVYLHEADEEIGSTVAERVRAAIEAATVQTDVGPVQVTVSVGGSLKDQLEHIELAIKRSDEALYQAKAQGRNRTVLDWQSDDDIRAAG